MVNVRDVANHAGVAVVTVSRVVNDPTKVSYKTRKKIEQSIKQLDYVPNRAARSVRTKRSGVIGLITDVVSTTPYSTDIILGVQEQIQKEQLSLFTVNSALDLNREAMCWQTLKEHRVDGVIYVTMFRRRVSGHNLGRNIPTVLVNCSAPDSGNVNAIEPDDEQGAEVATRYLINQGHKKIGYVRLNRNILAAELREKSVIETMKKEGVAVNPDWFVDGLVGPVFNDEYVGFSNTLKMLLGDERPSAILAGNDEIALQVACAANKLGITIPEELSLIGFDDFQVITNVYRPRLTSVRLPYIAMGKRAVRQMLNIINKPNLEPCSKLVPCELVVRDSVSSIPRQ